MAWSLPTGKKLRLVIVRLMIVTVVTLTPEHSTAADGAPSSNMLSLPGCPDKCGDVAIPYPFGFGDHGCFREGFNVTCDEGKAAYLAHKSFKIFDFNLSQGEVRVQKHISYNCNDGANNTASVPHLRLSVADLSNLPFVSLSTKNKFTAIGCDILAIIFGKNQHNYTSGCVSICDKDYIDDSTQCTGMGCCQTSIPVNLRTFGTGFWKVDFRNYPVSQNFSPCSYAFVAEQNWFNFSVSYANSTKFRELYGGKHRGVRIVLDWVVGNETCVEAQKNKSTYACLAKNSVCVDGDATSYLGYRCNCDPGYEGNPYLNDGCQDINECISSTHPCGEDAQCLNTPAGNYTCLCPSGTHSDDPRKMQCVEDSNNMMVIGISICSIFVIVCISVLILDQCQKRKLAKEKERFFKENGGPLLYQKILSKQVETEILFTVEDLAKATNNFDKSRELGTGGHGTVYKGILTDTRVVAVKRSKNINVAHAEEFVQEIIILSQINHKNVVRLLGCCLEVEVPILVYEFIPNGTLFHLIHGNHSRQPVSLEVRLRIAQESAEALAYLHLSTNHPIVHGDVKSLNILLDGSNMAKVIDFGLSRMLPQDAVQLMTMVQGTLGYLDPEYLQERKLTEKSDVYSFGVVLLEVITSKTAIYSEGTKEGKSLASSFLQAMKDNRVEEMLDTRIMSVGMEELLQELAGLAGQCLSSKGQERPSMSQVADKLKAIRNTWREILVQKHEETELLIGTTLGAASAHGLSSTGYWTARTLAMDIEAPNADHAVSSTSM